MADDCMVVDLYGYPVACDTPDPCRDGLTLWRVLACDGDTMDVFCGQYPDHPVCLAAPASTPHAPAPLPSTGAEGVLLLVAAVVTLAGAALRRLTRVRGWSA